MTTTDPSALRAVCVPLPATPGKASVDPVAVAADGGHLFVGPARTVAGHGTAAVLSLPRGLDDPAGLAAVRAWLAAVPVVQVPAVGGSPSPVPPRPVVAVGALPFDRGAPGTLTVPARAFCRSADGAEWLVGVGTASGRGARAAGGGSHRAGGDEAASEAAALLAWLAAAAGTTSSGAGGRPGDGTPAVDDVTFLPPGEGYAHAVADAVAAIRAGHLRKVVLARAVDVEFAAGSGRAPVLPAPGEVLRRLWAGDPSFTAFSVPVPEGRFVGASPELIVARAGREVSSLPLAGTVSLPAAGGAASDAAVARLLGSAKDLDEHRLVVEAVAAGLARRCDDVTVPDDPIVVRLRSDARLGTPVRALAPPARHGAVLGAEPAPGTEVDGCSALDLLAELHPTPAVGGVPRPQALARIGTLEAVPRGYWAGPVGWVDGSGDGEWVLAIRSVTLVDGRARVLAGAGIVAASDPRRELEETTVKLSPVLDALVPSASALLGRDHRPGAGVVRRQTPTGPTGPGGPAA
ncbi:MAG: isochorismate synthase [Acidimicrobiales bacterium]